MKQRRFVILATILFLTTPVLSGASPLSPDCSTTSNVSSTGQPIIHVENIPFSQDGISDDYKFLQAVASYISKNPNKTYVFPTAKSYRVDRFVDRSIVGYSGHLIYSNCNNVRILGCNSKIKVKGDYHRTSTRDTLMPFVFNGCKDFLLEGFELDGNVDQTTLEAGVVEGRGHGIATTASSNYSIRNIYVHHFPSDGLYLGGNSASFTVPYPDGTVRQRVDRNAVIENVLSANNGRQGLSIIHMVGGRIRDSQFANTGRVGAYGGHLPKAGIDVEPNEQPPVVEEYTHDIEFDNCIIAGNLGYQFLAGTKFSNDVRIKRSEIIAPYDATEMLSTPPYPQSAAVLLDGPNGLIEDSYIDVKRGAILVAGSRIENTKIPPVGYDPNAPGAEWIASTIIRDTHIVHEWHGLQAMTNGKVDISGTAFIANRNTRLKETLAPSNWREYYEISSAAPFLTSNWVSFNNNYIFIPKEAYDSARSNINVTGDQVVSRIMGSIGTNRMETDLSPSQSPFGNARFTAMLGSWNNRAAFSAYRGDSESPLASGNITIIEEREMVIPHGVTLRLVGVGGSGGIKTVALRNEEDTSYRYFPFSAELSWSFSSEQVNKTVYAHFIDGAGKPGPLISASAVLRPEAPTSLRVISD